MIHLTANEFKDNLGSWRDNCSLENYFELIKVRESTTELQVQVEGKLYVFGKSNGTLDKVKVGTDILEFSQIQSIEGLNSVKKSVSWKKLKDGSIQIQSTHSPWPSLLTWTVLENGSLKLEVAGEFELNSLQNIGLGFKIPIRELIAIDWSTRTGAKGAWIRNHDDQDHEKKESAFIEEIADVNLQFLSVGLSVHAVNSECDIKIDNFKTDSINPSKVLRFQPLELSSQIHQEPSDKKSGILKATHLTEFSPSSLILWFDFKSCNYLI